jgi:hypothetical protein
MVGIRTFALLLGLTAVDLAAAEVVQHRLLVIVSPSQPITDISLADLRRVYLGQLSRWPTRHRIVVVVPSPRSPEGTLFIKRVINMAELDYSQYWIGAVFRGQAAAAPLVAASPAEAKRFVASQPDAIAVIADVVTDSSVRVLTVDGKPASAADYPLAW